jgi:hypothetical protein
MLMSGYRIDGPSNSSVEGEALLLRTLPLTAPIVSVNPFSAAAPFGGSINFKDVYFPVLDAIIVSAADGTPDSVYMKEPPVAQECMVTWCVKTFKSSYAWGNHEESVTATYLNETARQNPYPWEVFPIYSQMEDAFFSIFHGNISVRPPGIDSSVADYGVSNETYSRTRALFDDMFPSSITVANATAPPWWRIKIFAWDYNQLRPVTTCPWLAPNNVTLYIEKLATSLTNVIRSHPSHEFVRGRAYTQTTFIAVRLEWLAFPLVLLFLSLAFLVATMIKTSQEKYGELGMWKTSAMPTLLYSLPEHTKNDIIPRGTMAADSHRRHQKIKIRLYPNQGWRISGQTHTSPISVTTDVRRAPPGWI